MTANDLYSTGGAKRRRSTKRSPRRRSSTRMVIRRPSFEEEVVDLVIRDKLYRPVVKKVYKKPSPAPAPAPSAKITIGGKKKGSPKRKSSRRSPRRVSPKPVVYRPSLVDELNELIIRDRLYRPVVRKVYINPSTPSAPAPAAPAPSAPPKPKPTSQFATQTPPQTGQIAIQTQATQIGVGGKKKRSPKRR
jgi:hypothetical protein